MPDTMEVNSATATTEAGPADRTLVIERVFKTSPEKVFKAWTDPAILVRWWGPEGFETPNCDLDVRPGGAWRSTMVSPDGKPHTVSGVYREISPPQRLVMTWGWENDGKRGHETEVELTFEPVATGTRMRLVQRVFETVESRNGHEEGWTSSFNDLERLFA
jgi:uncharacterized protein YndB with AHSA1/START domain